MTAIRSIVHPTDFSDLSAAAFAHALRIALAGRSKLHLLHVSQYDAAEALAFPHARDLLVQWGLSAVDDPPWVVAGKLGIEVDNIRLKLQEPTRGIVDFLSEDESDLVVIATHGRDGVSHWLQGSVAEAVFRHSAIPTLFIAPGARGFVDQVSGDVKLRRALVPVDFSPPADRTVDIIQRFGQLLTGANIAVDLLHVGEAAPPVHAVSSNAPALPPPCGAVNRGCCHRIRRRRHRHADGGTSRRSRCAARQHDRARHPPRAVSGAGFARCIPPLRRIATPH
jgi:nucleotide-binding universal stress UspA family protein